MSFRPRCDTPGTLAVLLYLFLQLILKSSLSSARRVHALLIRRWRSAGTILSANNLQIFIAITTSATTGISTLLEQNCHEANVLTYNITKNELDRINSWWQALSAIEQACDKILHIIPKFLQLSEPRRHTNMAGVRRKSGIASRGLK